MIKLKKHNPIRDLLMAVLLLLFIRSALHLEADRQKSGLQEERPFVVHEPSQEVVDAFTRAKQQFERAITLAQQKNHPEIIIRLQELIDTITALETRYTKHSPALLFLGPFASVSIVLKEREIEQQLADVTTELNKILSSLLGKEAENKYGPDKIELCLKKNQQLLAQFAISQPKRARA